MNKNELMKEKNPEKNPNTRLQDGSNRRVESPYMAHIIWDKYR